MRISFTALIAAVATGLIALRATAQDTPAPAAPPTNPAPVSVVPAAENTNASAKKAEPTKTAKPAAKPVAKKVEPQPEIKMDPVLHPEPAVAKQNNVNVRGQASINSEVITHLQKNDPITVLEDITLKKPKQDEPSRWYRVALPTNVSVWVHSSYVDKANNTVKPRRLNLRGGPGENYSVVGLLEKGAPVKQIDSKGDWLKIETPTNAYGFVAAHLVERTPVPAIVATPPKTNEVAAVPPTNPPPQIAELQTATPPVVPGAQVTPPANSTPPVTSPPTVPPPPVETVTDAPIEKVKKIVSREGVLKNSASIQAPAYFELRALDTGKTINYVFSPSTNLLLKQYKGQRIIVTGEEMLDERWQTIPVIIVDELQPVP